MDKGSKEARTVEDRMRPSFRSLDKLAAERKREMRNQVPRRVRKGRSRR